LISASRLLLQVVMFGYPIRTDEDHVRMAIVDPST